MVTLSRTLTPLVLRAQFFFLRELHSPCKERKFTTLLSIMENVTLKARNHSNIVQSRGGLQYFVVLLLARLPMVSAAEISGSEMKLAWSQQTGRQQTFLAWSLSKRSLLVAWQENVEYTVKRGVARSNYERFHQWANTISWLAKGRGRRVWTRCRRWMNLPRTWSFPLAQ